MLFNKYISAIATAMPHALVGAVAQVCPESHFAYCYFRPKVIDI